MMPTVARLVAANAAVTVAAAASCSAPSATRISRRRYCVAATAFERGLDRGQAQVGDLLGAGDPGPAPLGRRRGRGPRRPPGRPGSIRATLRRALVCRVRVLVGAGENFDRFRIGAVAGQRAVVVPVGAYQIGQQLGVGGIGFGARDVVTVTVVGRSLPVARCPQIPLAAGPIVVRRT